MKCYVVENITCVSYFALLTLIINLCHVSQSVFLPDHRFIPNSYGWIYTTEVGANFKTVFLLKRLFTCSFKCDPQVTFGYQKDISRCQTTKVNQMLQWMQVSSTYLQTQSCTCSAAARQYRQILIKAIYGFQKHFLGVGKILFVILSLDCPGQGCDWTLTKYRVSLIMPGY